MAFGRLALNSGTEIGTERQAAMIETLRSRYTDQQIVQALDVLALSWKPQYGQGLATVDIVQAIEGQGDDPGRLLTYQQMLVEFEKVHGGGSPLGPKLHDLYQMVTIDGGGQRWRKR